MKFLVSRLGLAGLALGVGWWVAAATAQQESPALSEQAFQISVDALENLLSPPSLRDAGGGGGADPFAAPDDPEPLVDVSDLQAHLVGELGIEFPEGTYVRHDPETGKLDIRHQPGVVKAIEAYLRALDQFGEKQINIRTEIYEMPARAGLKVQQLCGPMNDHAPVWKLVQEMLENNQASFVNSGSVIARSGQRARHQDKREVIYPTEVDWNEKEDAVLPAAFETRNVGLEFEVDPVIGADDYTIDLNFNLEYHTAPPVMREIATISSSSGRVVAVEMPEFHAKQITTCITTGNGMIKCVGAWRPTGSEEFEEQDLVHVVFLRTEIQVMNSLRGWEGKN